MVVNTLVVGLQELGTATFPRLSDPVGLIEVRAGDRLYECGLHGRQVGGEGASVGLALPPQTVVLGDPVGVIEQTHHSLEVVRPQMVEDSENTLGQAIRLCELEQVLVSEDGITGDAEAVAEEKVCPLSALPFPHLVVRQ